MQKPYIPDPAAAAKPYIPDGGVAIKPYIPDGPCSCCGGASQCPSGVPEVWGAVSGPALWQASTAYVLGDYCQSTAGDTYTVTTAGTSGASEPAWDTTIGNTTADNDVVWTRQNLTVNWCGQSWSLTADSGVEKLFCGARTTGKTHVYSTTNTGIFPAKELWHGYDVWTILGLRLGRQVATSLVTNGTTSYFRRGGQSYNMFYLGVLNNYNKLDLFATLNGSISVIANDLMTGFAVDLTRPIPGTLLNTDPAFQQFDIGVLVNTTFSFNTGFADYSNYLLTNTFFGNTTLSGITYSWRKGNGW
jgi:hypothetical protein